MGHTCPLIRVETWTRARHCFARSDVDVWLRRVRVLAALLLVRQGQTLACCWIFWSTAAVSASALVGRQCLPDLCTRPSSRSYEQHPIALNLLNLKDSGLDLIQQTMYLTFRAGPLQDGWARLQRSARPYACVPEK
jgi:hypothetical protein